MLAEEMMKNKLMEWTIKLLEKSTTKEIHLFSLDFGSALLANIIHAKSTLDFLEKNPAVTKDVTVLF